VSAILGKLFVVATPIGNLEDITLRALRVLREADLIAAEDTRRTGLLLAHYNIHKPLISCHEFNEAKRTPELLQKLQEGQRIALVSDAGMPTISDPGLRLIRAVLETHAARNSVHRSPPMEGQGVGSVSAANAASISTSDAPRSTLHAPPPIAIEIIPGPSAVTAALAASGLAAGPFLFYGFLPHKSAQRRKALSVVAPLPYTLVFFESPYRLTKTLADMLEVFGDRQAVIARELTKKFEEILRGELGVLLKSLENRTVKGEITLIVEGRAK
jgi:16S rRNA (cytidine1402-2'-O)-methyltransferase